MTTVTGMFPDVSIDAYHADQLTPEPALSSSGIRTLLNATPAHFAARNPRLTEYPDQIERPTKQQTLGTVFHRLILGKGADIDLYEFKDWKTKEAQMMRDASLAAGKIPVLPKVYRQAEILVEKATPKLIKRFGAWPIGQSEVGLVWKRPTTSGTIYGRALVDHISEGSHEIDFKSTELSLDDVSLAKKVANDGSDIQAAWYLEGLWTLYPEIAGRGDFTFVFQEVEPPYDTRFVTLTENWLTRARLRIERAANLFGECIKKGQWPGWEPEAVLNPPSYLETAWANAELEEAV